MYMYKYSILHTHLSFHLLPLSELIHIFTYWNVVKSLEKRLKSLYYGIRDSQRFTKNVLFKKYCPIIDWEYKHARVGMQVLDRHWKRTEKGHIIICKRAQNQLWKASINPVLLQTLNKILYKHEPSYYYSVTEWINIFGVFVMMENCRESVKKEAVI